MSSGLVSILTPTVAARKDFFSRCCASVKSQTYPTIDHVVEYEEGIGPMAAFQSCLDMATGEYVLPLGDDDWLAPHAVETWMPYLQTHDLVFGRTLIVSPGNDRLVAGHSAMWRKSVTDEHGGYDLRFKHAGDTELYGRLIEAGVSFTYCPEPLYFFTEHATHNGHVYRAELVHELDEIQLRYADAHRKLAQVVPA